MGKKAQVVAGRSKADRAKVRKGVSLKSLVVQDSTERRYKAAVFSLFKWMEQEGLAVPDTAPELDLVAADFVSHLWEEGDARADASNLVAGLQHFSPQLRRKLPCTWRLINAWQKHEIPARATPFMESQVESLAGYFLENKLPHFAVGCLVGFHCLLRTGEITPRKASDFHVNEACTTAVVSLGLTKSGQRQGALESITIQDAPLVRMVAAWLEGCSPGDLLFPKGPFHFRKKLREGMQALGFDCDQYKPYSLRRGGATHHFRSHGQMSLTVVRGRWASEKSARIYINDGLATLAAVRQDEGSLRKQRHYRKRYLGRTQAARAK